MRFEFVSKYADCGLALPRQATRFSAGYDLAAAQDTIIPPYRELYDMMSIKGNVPSGVTLDEMADFTKLHGTRPTLVSTGVKCQLDPGTYLKLVARSSLPLKHWLIVANGEGIIDADYWNNEANEGEIFVQLINLSPVPILIRKGEKICQGIIEKYETVDGAETTVERKGGFGSTNG